MDEMDKRILEYLKQHEKGMSGEIAKELKNNRSTISRHLQYLKREEQIEEFIESGHSVWRMKEEIKKFNDRLTSKDLTERSIPEFNIESVKRELDTLKNPIGKGTQAEIDYIEKFRHLFPPIMICKLNDYEIRIIIEVIKHLEKKFKENINRERIVDIFGMISRCDNDLIHELFQKNIIPIIEGSYDSLTLPAKKDAISIFQRHSSDKNRYIFNLIIDAIENWDDEKFNYLKKTIDLSSLENKECNLEELKILRIKYELKNEIERIERIKFFIDRLNQMVG